MRVTLSIFLYFLSVFSLVSTSANTGTQFENLQLVPTDQLSNKIDDSLEDVLDENDIRNFSPIYDQILNRYSSEYQTIADRLSGDEQNGAFGGPNMIGWKHAGDFSAFKIVFNRSAAPMIDGDGAIVNDTIFIEIDAMKFIDELADENIIRITEVNKKAFAGLKFRRELRYNHFASSVNEGLQTNADKLFFMFKYFNIEHFNKLRDYDYLVKEDSFIFSAGGLYTSPIGGTGIAAGVGAMLDYEKSTKVTIQKLGVDDQKSDNEDIRINVENSKVTRAGVNVSVVIDFFKLLNLTLFQYDYVYDYSHTNKVYFNFSHLDLLDNEKKKELKKALALKPFDVDLLAQNIVSKETRAKETRESKYLAFIFGGIKDAETEKREIIKDGVLTHFFSHTYRRLRYTENFFSKILNLFLGKFLGQGLLTKRTDVSENKTNINYESERNIIQDKEDFNIFDKNIFTMYMSYQKSYHQKTKLNEKKIKSSIKDSIKSHTDSYNTFNNVLNDFKFDAPASFYVKRVFDNHNIKHFSDIEENTIKGIIKESCKNKSRSIFKKFRSLFSGCRHKLTRSYSNFLKEWETQNYDIDLYKKCRRRSLRYSRSLSFRRTYLSKCLEKSSYKEPAQKSKELPLWRFKDFASNVNNYVQQKYLVEQLFGSYYNWGWVSANLDGQIPYKNYFKEGEPLLSISEQFNIENQLTRIPASLNEDLE